MCENEAKMSDDQWEFLNRCIKNSTDKGSNDLMKLSSTNLGYTRKNNIPQMVPQPAGMPWSIGKMSWGSFGNTTSPVEFTATLGERNRYPVDSKLMFNALPCKRKSDVEIDGPRKQLITEEKMAASFGGMHISCNYTSHNINPANADAENGDMDLEMQGPRIVLSPEAMKIQPEPILPPCLINRIEKPCTSLVLWQPPSKMFPTIQDVKDPNNNPGDSQKLDRRRKGVLEAAVDEITNSNATTSSHKYNQENSYNMDVEM